MGIFIQVSLATAPVIMLISPYYAKSIYSNFHALEVVSRYRDPQLQVGGNVRFMWVKISHIAYV